MWSKMAHFFNLLFQTRFLLLVDCYDMLFVAWKGFAAEIQGILGVYTQPSDICRFRPFFTPVGAQNEL